jgi:hypothetical protein
MLEIALAFFLTGAVAGIFLAFRHFTAKPLPMPVAIVHGLAGATGLVILLLAVLADPTFGAAGYALCVLLGAAVLGFVNFSFHLRGRRHYSAVVLVHALVAVTGAGTLLYAILTNM